jgi:hypothetical protein
MLRATRSWTRGGVLKGTSAVGVASIDTTTSGASAQGAVRFVVVTVVTPGVYLFFLTSPTT